MLIGQAIRYDTCRRRGVVEDALTNFTEGSTVWFLRGNVAQDSSSSRIYAGSADITSCDLPTPHYHFSAGEVKWISRNVLVARPVVLYVRDVPILWLPFIFQDVRPGRRSGILVPQIGLNDLVRPTRSYNRQITNIGYYWAPNDYMDVTARLDWFANRYVQYGVAGQYRWLNRFMSGSASVNEQRQVDGASAMTLRWDHRQEFNLSTSLNLSFNYASNNAVDTAERDRPTAEHAADHQLAQLLQALRLGHAHAGRQPAPEHHGRQRATALSRGHPVAGADRGRLGHHLVARTQLYQQHHVETTVAGVHPGSPRRHRGHRQPDRRYPGDGVQLRHARPLRRRSTGPTRWR